MKNRLIAFLAGIVVCVVCIALFTHANTVTVNAAGQSRLSKGISDTSYQYPVNDRGETYGLDWEGDDYDEHAPDLIKAVGKNGVKGYVKRVDLQTEGDRISSPEEAVAYQKIKDARHGSNYYLVIPVFDKDGETELDQFWIYNGSTKEERIEY